MALQPGRNYNISIEAQGHLFHSENLLVPDTACYIEIVRPIDLVPVKIGESVVLKNIMKCGIETRYLAAPDGSGQPPR